jgi:hypothetical protein
MIADLQGGLEARRLGSGHGTEAGAPMGEDDRAGWFQFKRRSRVRR